jgi:hypothetical protein
MTRVRQGTWSVRHRDDARPPRPCPNLAWSRLRPSTSRSAQLRSGARVSGVCTSARPAEGRLLRLERDRRQDRRTAQRLDRPLLPAAFAAVEPGPQECPGVAVAVAEQSASELLKGHGHSRLSGSAPGSHGRKTVWIIRERRKRGYSWACCRPTSRAMAEVVRVRYLRLMELVSRGYGWDDAALLAAAPVPLSCVLETIVPGTKR